MREAFELMNEMVGHGYYPLAPTFNALISGFCRQGMVSSALKLIDDMVVRGCKLDIGSIIPWLMLCVGRGIFKRLLGSFHKC